jgi:hypothetical protein
LQRRGYWPTLLASYRRWNAAATHEGAGAIVLSLYLQNTVTTFKVSPFLLGVGWYSFSNAILLQAAVKEKAKTSPDPDDLVQSGDVVVVLKL